MNDDKFSPAPLPGREAIARELWDKACLGREGYCSSDLRDAALTAIGEALVLAERAARNVDLPRGYQWSEGNREKFYFGRDTAADAILALFAQPAAAVATSADEPRGVGADFDPVAFGRRVQIAMLGRPFRTVADEAKVSPATLNRVSRGHMPDLPTYIALCRWLIRAALAAPTQDSASGEQR